LPAGRRGASPTSRRSRKRSCGRWATWRRGTSFPRYQVCRPTPNGATQLRSRMGGRPSGYLRHLGAVDVALKPRLPIAAGELVEGLHQAARRPPTVAETLDVGAQERDEVAVALCGAPLLA